ncbi:MAG: DUF4393 domain-containing protein [Lachnospiraceae bacterium]|jgi:hypothetical protein|nr:DUF4393 domain-containing protein [Lachnospiraceae bacterium]
MSEGLDKLAGAIGDTLKTAPTIYEDALQQTTQESGKTLALIPRAINAALIPLRQWISEREYKLAETEKLLAQKLEHVEEDKIVTPEAYVAVPAIQAISYSMNSEELRNLYANLLAKAMNSDTKDRVHPSFVEMIKQMSPNDAIIFSKIITSPIRPLITINVKSSKGGAHSFAENCSWISNFSLTECRTSFDNLSRLGLIQIPFVASYTNKNNYNSVKNNPLFKQAVIECKNNLLESESITYVEGYIKINELSKLFFNVCVKNS